MKIEPNDNLLNVANPNYTISQLNMSSCNLAKKKLNLYNAIAQSGSKT